MATKQRHTHIVAEDANGQPFERVEDSAIKALTAHMVIANCGGRIMRNVYCSKPIAECRKPENLIGGGPPEPTPAPGAPVAAPTVTGCANGVPVVSVDRATFEDTARAVRQQPATCQRCSFVAPQHAPGCVNTDRPRCPDCGQYWCSGCANLGPDPDPQTPAALAAPTGLESWQDHPYQDAPCHDCDQPIHAHQRTDNGPVCPPMTPAAAELPPYNPEDGAPCAQCGHGQELHGNGTEDCWWSSDATPSVFCACRRFQARDAAQRADEAELLGYNAARDTLQEPVAAELVRDGNGVPRHVDHEGAVPLAHANHATPTQDRPFDGRQVHQPDTSAPSIPAPTANEWAKRCARNEASALDHRLGRWHRWGGLVQATCRRCAATAMAFCDNSGHFAGAATNELCTPTNRADEAEMQAGLLATLPPMAGGAPQAWQAHNRVLTDAYKGLPRYCQVTDRQGTLHSLSCGAQVHSPSTLYHPGAPMPCLPCTQAHKALAGR